jgi:hypothetical protein
MSATYQNRREARKALYTETILPLLDRIADDLNNWLVPQFGESLTLAYDADSIEALQEDREALFNQIQKADWLTVNEQRVMAGYDEREEADVILAWKAKAPLQDLSVQAQAEAQTAANQADMPSQPSTTGQASAPVPEIKAAADLAKINEAMDARREYWAGIYEPKIRKALRTGLDEIAAQVEGGNSNPSYGSLGDLKPVLTSLYDKVGRDFAGIISKSYKPRKKAAGLRETKAVFENVRPMWDSWVESTVASQVSLIDETTKAEIQAVIVSGLDQGLTYATIAGMVRQMYEITDAGALPGDYQTNYQYRPMLISRTESGIASAKGAHMEAQSLNQDIRDLGLELRKRWVSIIDSRSRPDHAKLHGKVLPLDEQWNVGGSMMMHPKDISGGAENICNCRCDEVYVEVPIGGE